jgi:hypothetical protein
MGWILVGTQYRHDTVEEALQKDTAMRVLPSTPSQREPGQVQEIQQGIISRSQMAPIFDVAQIRKGTFEYEMHNDGKVLIFPGVDVRGDECIQGPSFNYARVFSWYQLSRVIMSALDSMMWNIHNRHTVRSMEIDGQSNTGINGQAHSNNNGQGDGWNDEHVDNNLTGNAAQLAKYCGLDNPPCGTLPAYVPFKEMYRDESNRVGLRMLGAAFTAMLVQWGTTGAAIIIAYLTPVTGLGCRSGAYLLYGGLGTLGWALLVLAMIFSHQAMLRYQSGQCETSPDVGLRNGNPQNQNTASGQPPHHRHPPNGHYQPINGGSSSADRSRPTRRSLGFHIYSAMAVGCLLFGRLVVISNAAWLIIISLLEIVGVFDNCWCNANHISLGDRGWVLLFKGAPELKAEAEGVWKGGVALSVTIALGSFFLLLLGSKRW